MIISERYLSKSQNIASIRAQGVVTLCFLHTRTCFTRNHMVDICILCSNSRTCAPGCSRERAWIIGGISVAS